MLEREVTIRKSRNGYILLYYGSMDFDERKSGTSEVCANFESVVRAVSEFMEDSLDMTEPDPDIDGPDNVLQTEGGDPKDLE